MVAFQNLQHGKSQFNPNLQSNKSYFKRKFEKVLRSAGKTAVAGIAASLIIFGSVGCSKKYADAKVISNLLDESKKEGIKKIEDYLLKFLTSPDSLKREIARLEAEADSIEKAGSYIKDVMKKDWPISWYFEEMSDFFRKKEHYALYCFDLYDLGWGYTLYQSAIRRRDPVIDLVLQKLDERIGFCSDVARTKEFYSAEEIERIMFLKIDWPSWRRERAAMLKVCLWACENRHRIESKGERDKGKKDKGKKAIPEWFEKELEAKIHEYYSPITYQLSIKSPEELLDVNIMQKRLNEIESMPTDFHKMEALYRWYDYEVVWAYHQLVKKSKITKNNKDVELIDCLIEFDPNIKNIFFATGESMKEAYLLRLKFWVWGLENKSMLIGKTPEELNLMALVMVDELVKAGRLDPFHLRETVEGLRTLDLMKEIIREVIDMKNKKAKKK